MKQHNDSIKKGKQNDVIIWDECNDIDFGKLNLLTIDFASLYPPRYIIKTLWDNRIIKKSITLKQLLE